MPIIVESTSATPVTLTGILGNGNDVVLRRLGSRHVIDENRFQGNEDILVELKANKDAGDVRIFVQKINGFDYEQLDRNLDDRVNYEHFGQGAPDTSFIQNILFNDNGEVGTWFDKLSDVDLADGDVILSIDMFPNPSATNAAFYIGTNTRTALNGIDLVVQQSLAGGDSADIIAEYWNGAAWIQATTMAALRKSPFTRRWVSRLFNTVGAISLWIDRNVYSLSVTKSLNGSVRHWLRFSIDSGSIATQPVKISRLRLHRSASGFAADGSRTSWGQGRRAEARMVSLDKLPAAGAPNVVATPISANISVREASEHPAVSDTHIIGQYGVETWVDVSSRIHPRLRWKADTLGGNIHWRLTVAQSSNGDIEDGTLAEVTETIVETGFLVDEINITTFASIDISALIPGAIITFKVERVGTADTNAGNAYRRMLGVLLYRTVEGGTP